MVVAEGKLGSSGGQTIDMRCWWWSERENMFYLLERDSLPSPSLICTVRMPRMGEPELEEFVGQGRRQEVERA